MINYSVGNFLELSNRTGLRYAIGQLFFLVGTTVWHGMQLNGRWLTTILRNR